MQKTGLILQIASIFLITEAIISILYSEDMQFISSIGRYMRILIGVIVLIVSFRMIVKN